MNLADTIDRVAMAVSPEWGSRRVMSRKAHALQLKAADMAERRVSARMEAAFDSADNNRLRGSRWMQSRLSINDQILREQLDSVRNCETLYRNDAIARSAVDGRVDNVVGCGIRFQARIRPGGTITPEAARELNAAIDEKQALWARAVNLPRVQRQLERSRALYGESFLILGDRSTLNAPVPLVPTVIHPSRVATPSEQLGKRSIKLGIEFNDNDEPLAYYVRRAHPDAATGDALKFDRIPADRVLHDFEPLIPGQVRGMPWLSPVAAELRDLRDFGEAHLISEQVSACQTRFIKTKSPYAQAIGAAAETLTDGGRIEEVFPGQLEYIGQDDDVVFNDPNRPGGNFGPYVEARLRSIAAGLRYPFELLAKVFTSNQSNGRLALIDGRITFRCWQQQAIASTWWHVGRRFIFECVTLGEIPLAPGAYQQDPERYLAHAWIPPGWPWVDPVRDSQAAVLTINNRLGTRSQVLGGQGHDFEEITQESTRERIRELEAEAEVAAARREISERFGVDLADDAGATDQTAGVSDDGMGDRAIENEDEPAEPAEVAP